jgi:uncharacterized membrane protein
LGQIDSPQTTLLNKVEEKILEKYTDIWIPCDQLIAAAVVEPNVISANQIHNMSNCSSTHVEHLMLAVKRSHIATYICDNYKTQLKLFYGFRSLQEARISIAR